MADIRIDGEKITAIGLGLEDRADLIVDAQGKYVMPGGVDQHTHFNFTFRSATVRGFETSHAALAGGTTTVVDFANQKIGWTIKDSIDEYMEQKVVGKAMCDYAFHGVVFDPSPALFKEVERLPEIGVPTIKLFMAYKDHPYHCDDDSVFKALQAAKDAGVTIMVHAEKADVIDVLQKQLLAEGKTGPYYHCGFDWKTQKHLGKDDFTGIPNGAPGLENRLAVLWTYGVAQGKISRQKFVELFATAPAKINGLFPRKGHISIGGDADIVVLDPDFRGVMSVRNSLQGVDYCTYEGMEQIGRVEKVFLRGKLTVDQGAFIGQAGQGAFIKGQPFGLVYQE